MVGSTPRLTNGFSLSVPTASTLVLPNDAPLPQPGDPGQLPRRLPAEPIAVLFRWTHRPMDLHS